MNVYLRPIVSISRHTLSMVHNQRYISCKVPEYILKKNAIQRPMNTVEMNSGKIGVDIRLVQLQEKVNKLTTDIQNWNDTFNRDIKQIKNTQYPLTIITSVILGVTIALLHR